MRISQLVIQLLFLIVATFIAGCTELINPETPVVELTPVIANSDLSQVVSVTLTPLVASGNSDLLITRTFASPSPPPETTITDVAPMPLVTPTPTIVLSNTDIAPIVFFYAPDGHLYRTNLLGSSLEQLTTVADETEDAWRAFTFYRPVQVSPDGRWVALSGGWGGWALLDLVGKETVGAGRGRAMRLSTWSPDGKELAYLGIDNKLCIYSLVEQTDRCVFQESNQLIGALWSPDGSYIALAAVNPECCMGQVWLVNPLSGEAEVVSTFFTTFETVISEFVAWVLSDSSLLVKTTGEGPSSLYFPWNNSSRQFEQPVRDISPDGQYILFNSAEINRIDGTVLYIPLPPCANGEQTLLQNWSWSPNGKLVAYLVACQESGGLTILFTVNLSTGNLIWQQEMPEPFQVMYWSPDSHYLLFDKADASPTDSPIWRLAIDNPDAIEPIITEGFLLGVIPQWDIYD